MAAAHKSARWDETALVVATLINANMAKGKQVTVEDIHPFKKSGKSAGRGDVSVKLTRDNISMLKHFAVNQGRDKAKG